ncbi:MAG: LysM peptidoglycan-binding domain-containing protein [Desulfobacterales bacterium]|nr:LysM peptidoglycan-binding domain-containing protein [Desulfobacterales bacterium]
MTEEKISNSESIPIHSEHIEDDDDDYEDDNERLFKNSKNETTYMIIGSIFVVGVVVIILFLTMLFKTTKSKETAPQLPDTSKLQTELDDQLKKLDSIESQLEKFQRDIAQLKLQITSSASIRKMIEEKVTPIYTKIDQLEKTKIPHQEPVQKPAVDTKETTQPSTKVAKNVRPKPVPNQDKNKKHKAQQVYKVNAGDTLFSISRKFNITLDQLLKSNNLSSGSIISLGQELIIPQ